MSCTNNTGNINKTFIIEAVEVTGDTSVSACTAVYTNKIESCSGDTEVLLTDGATIFNTNLEPKNDSSLGIGSKTKRFREINVVSGTTSLWVSETKVKTPEIDFGDDSLGNSRKITANNSIIQDDCLFGGTY